MFLCFFIKSECDLKQVSASVAVVASLPTEVDPFRFAHLAQRGQI